MGRLAGLPPSVIERAKVILAELEAERTELSAALGADEPMPPTRGQLALFPPTHDPLLKELAALDLGSLTPLQALNLLSDWQQRLKGRR